MDFFTLAQGIPTDPGGSWGATLAVVSALSVIATYVAGTLLQRRRGKSDFTGEVLKEMEFWKSLTSERDKIITTLRQENASLHDQNRALGQENGRLVRQEHKEVLERLEALITRAEASRIGARGTDIKLDEIHQLVNNRLDDALEKIEKQGSKLTTALRTIESLELRLRDGDKQ